MPTFSMKRRDVLRSALAVPLLHVLPALAGGAPAPTKAGFRRMRPGDAGWPGTDEWNQLGQAVGGRLRKLASPLSGCTDGAQDCAALAHLDNPYFVGDEPALTQTSGWADAWRSHPSAYAVAAESTADVVAAVDFARRHRLRLVVKGGGHSYQGTSSAPDSLLVWTRHMKDVTLHDAFVADGCDGPGQPAASLGAGAMWVDAYDAVTTKGQRYVQGGGCMTVGVAGLIQSGGFGSFSKCYGLAAAGLIEAEIVTADGKVLVANACREPELFWGLKGGGGGSLGVVTRVTLRTHALPEFFGGVFGAIRATTDAAYRELIGKAVAFYRDALFNAHWGEQMVFTRDRTLRLQMVFQGLDQAQAERTWAPFFEWVRARKAYSIEGDRVIGLPARHLWDPAFFAEHAPGLMGRDDRPGAASDRVFWAGDQGEVGQFLHAYRSAWLPAALLREDRAPALADALFEAAQHAEFALHFNKGLAGAPQEAIAAARDTAMNPQVLDAFALAICAHEGAPAYPGMPGPAPDLAEARRHAARVHRAMGALLRVAPGAGSYVSESDYFERDWQRVFWGDNYQRLARVKQVYDPDGLFFVHHGVGSDGWSADGFERISPTE